MSILSPAAAAAIARLRAFKPPSTQYHNLPLARRAAVLILLFADRKGDLRVVLTIRAAKMKNYAGQAALPGGKADTLSETPFQTARREAFEEIGLPLSDDKLPPGYSVEHLTELPSNLAVTELGVRPCVAFLKAGATAQPGASPTDSNGGQKTGHQSTPNTRLPDPARDFLPRLSAPEVAAVFTAPFHNFLTPTDEDPATTSMVPGDWYKGAWHQWHEESWRMHQFYVPVGKGNNFRGKSGPSPEGEGVSDNMTDQEDNPPSSTTEAQPSYSADAAKKLPDWDPKSTTARSNPKPLDTNLNASNMNPLDAPRYRVFGMTARILVDCARVAYGTEPEFEHNSHFGDEDMIGRLRKLGRLGEKRIEGEKLDRPIMIKAAKL